MKNKLVERREKHAELIKPLSEKYSIAEIAEKIGVSIGTVCSIQNDPRFGIKNPRRKYPGYNKVERDHIQEGYFDYKKMGDMF